MLGKAAHKVWNPWQQNLLDQYTTFSPSYSPSPTCHTFPLYAPPIPGLEHSSFYLPGHIHQIRSFTPRAHPAVKVGSSAPLEKGWGPGYWHLPQRNAPISLQDSKQPASILNSQPGHELSQTRGWTRRARFCWAHAWSGRGQRWGVGQLVCSWPDN